MSLRKQLAVHLKRLAACFVSSDLTFSHISIDMVFLAISGEKETAVDARGTAPVPELAGETCVLTDVFILSIMEYYSLPVSFCKDKIVLGGFWVPIDCLLFGWLTLVFSSVLS